MKKTMIWMLALMLCCVFAAHGAAEAVPSVTVEAVTKVEAAIVTTAGTEVAEEDEVTMAIVLNEPTIKEQQVFEEISAHVETMPIVEYFAPEVIEQAVAVLPEGKAVEELKMHEFYAVDTINYEETYGDVEAVFEFATTYEEGKTFVAMIGIISENGEITWMPMSAEVVDGKVKILFTQEVLMLLAENEAVCALLGD